MVSTAGWNQQTLYTCVTREDEQQWFSKIFFRSFEVWLSKCTFVFSNVFFCFSCLQLYRTEDFSSCLSVYKDLVKNTQDDFEDEREANLASVFAALETWGGGAEVPQEL